MGLSMPPRFAQRDIASLFLRLRMTRLRKGGAIYAGVGPDGVFRKCVFHYHSDQTPVATGTADAIAHALGLGNAQGMKDFIDHEGWKRN